MRSRFFLTTLFVLVAVSIGTIAIHAHFLRTDRLQLIDQQVRETAAALLDSELNDLRKIDFDAADDIISDELGASRIGKFFVIRNAKDEIIFKSTSAELLSLSEVPRNPQWLTYEIGNKFIRVLNLQLPRVNDRTLQVGVVIDRNLIEFNYFSVSTLLVFITVLTIGLGVSWVVSFFLMRPIGRLENFLSLASSEKNAFVPSLPHKFLKRANLGSRDEFLRLIFRMKQMIDSVNRNYRSSRLWSYQMAHELKTPLTLMQISAERIQRNMGQSEEVRSLQSEIQKTSDIIQSFLSWAELENSGQQKHLFALRVGKIVEAEVDRLSTLYPSRVSIVGSSNSTVLANPQHLEQLIHNLLVNALEYSGTKLVTIYLVDNCISIKDHGSGIPVDVLERIGEPFNQGSSSNKEISGHGLGLAWVKTISRQYGWVLSIDSSSGGTSITVDFAPKAEDTLNSL